MKLEDLLLDEKLSNLLQKYVSHDDEVEIAERHAIWRGRLSAKSFVIPVTGVQGSGKSTLLNALLFEEPVLPIDADETTCVPVEIVWASEPSRNAMVVFENGTEEAIPATQESLSMLVDNQNNPGNQLNVKKVILESSSRLLKNGIVMVDLPGLGSLTPENAETTHEYLKQAVGILFMLRTVPPITQSESLFIKLNWSRIPSAVFAQNRWADETEEECQEGKYHNILVLKRIAEKISVGNIDDIGVTVVNAYSALKGVLSRNHQLREASGLKVLEERVSEIGENWPELVSVMILNALRMEITESEELIKYEIGLLNSSASDAENRMKQREGEFNRYIAKARERKKQAISEINEFEIDANDTVADWRSKSGKDLRNTMRKKLRSGIVDGPRLEKALIEEQRVRLEEIYSSITDKVFALTDKLNETFSDIPDWKLSNSEELFRTVRRKGQPKLENLFPRVLGAGGAIGGGALGVKGGAALGTLIMPGVGTVVGGIVGGIIGGLFGGIFGGKAGKATKRAIMERRARAIEPAVFQAIKDFVSESSHELESQINDCAVALTGAIESWEEKQIRSFRDELDNFRRVMDMKDTERKQTRTQLVDDLKTIEQYANTVKEEF